MKQNLGLQLYTLRGVKNLSFSELVHEVALMGYTGIEFPTDMMERLPSNEVKAVMQKEKLTTIGIVFNKEDLTERIDQVIAYCKDCDCPCVALPGFFEKQTSADGFIHYAKLLNTWGSILKQHGLEFIYHVHGHEFDTFEGKLGMDIMMDMVDLSVCRLEIDVYWVEWGKQDAVQFLRKYGHACSYLHLKDMTDRDTFHDTEIGAGCIDMKAVVTLGINYKVKWMIVEQEQFDIPQLDSVCISLHNVQALLMN